VDNSLQRAIQKMGGDFLVAAFVPAMAFIIICSLTFESLLPPPLRYNTNNPLQSSLNLLLFTAILGFTLHTISTYVYKVFEGYTSPFNNKNPIGRSFLRRQKRRFKKNEANLARVTKQLEKVQKNIEKPSSKKQKSPWQARRTKRYENLQQLLLDQRYDLIANREMGFPPSVKQIMPTRFGNILKAAEMYPATRYNIDSVQLWGRLSHVIPDSGMRKIDHANNQSLFLLNSTLLASAYAVLCIIFSLYQWMLLKIPHHNSLFFSIGTKLCDIDLQKNIFGELVLAVLASGVAWVFYEASLFNVNQFGDMIRTAYDLYRFNLLDALRLPLPVSLDDEKQTWLLVSQFMVGNDKFGKVHFEYEHPPRTSPRGRNKQAIDNEEEE
jgi:hypothetical protein